jgi:hypothetical protein
MTIMQSIKGYIFDTESDAQYYCDLCTEYYSPLPDGWVWVEYIVEKSNGKNTIIIPYDDSLESILVPLLGEPIEIEIDEPLNLGR